MVDIRELKPGTLVRIVDEWNGQCFQNGRGHMDEYLGQVVTIDEVLKGFGGKMYRFHIKEDHRYRYGSRTDKWVFNQYCVAEIVDKYDEPDDMVTWELPPVFGTLF